MVADLMRSFSVGAAVLGNLSAFYFYAYSGLQIPVGLLLDRFGPRRLMSLAALGVAVGTLLFAVSTTIEGAYAGRLIIGAGCAFSWAGTLAIVNQWFPSRFAVLAGVSQMVAMGGAILGQAPLAAVVESTGWRATLQMLAIVGGVLAVSIYWIVRDRTRPASSMDRPPTSTDTVVRNPQTWLAAGFGLAMTAPMLAFGALWGVPYLSAVHGIERTEAAGIASLVFLGNGLGGVLIGWWSDRIRRRKGPMLAGGTLCVCSQLLFLLVPTLPLWTVAALVFLSGAGGASMVLAFATAREHNSLARAGLTIGIINTAVTGSGALLQPIIGWLLDLGWDGRTFDGARVYSAEIFRLAMLVVPGVGLLGLALLGAIRETHAAQRS